MCRSGLEVKVAETTGEALEIGRTRLHNSLTKAAERGKITEEERDATLARLTFTTDLGEFADRDLVIEPSSRTSRSRPRSSRSSTR